MSTGVQTPFLSVPHADSNLSLYISLYIYIYILILLIYIYIYIYISMYIYAYMVVAAGVVVIEAVCEPTLSTDFGSSVADFGPVLL